MSDTKVNLFSEAAGGYEVEFFAEAVKGKKEYFFEGIVAQAETLNGNRRIYPHDVLMPAVERYKAARVDRNLAMGELDHPETLVVQMQKVSHLFTDLRIEGNNVIGKAKLTKTPMGEIAKGLIDSGIQLGVSTRGGGRDRKKRDHSVMEAFVLTAIDMVSYPSAPEAFPEVTNEALEFIVESGLLSVAQADAHTKLNSMSSSEFERHMRDLVTSIKL